MSLFCRSHPHGGHGRAHHHGRGRAGTPGANEWCRNPVGIDSTIPSVETSNIVLNTEAGDRSVSCPLKNEGENRAITCDSNDNPAEVMEDLYQVVCHTFWLKCLFRVL